MSVNSTNDTKTKTTERMSFKFYISIVCHHSVSSRTSFHPTISRTQVGPSDVTKSCRRFTETCDLGQITSTSVSKRVERTWDEWRSLLRIHYSTKIIIYTRNLLIQRLFKSNWGGGSFKWRIEVHSFAAKRELLINSCSKVNTGLVAPASLGWGFPNIAPRLCIIIIKIN